MLRRSNNQTRVFLAATYSLVAASSVSAQILAPSNGTAALQEPGASPETTAEKLPFHFVIEKATWGPVIDTTTPGAEDNKFGFEGGVVVKIGPIYYLLTDELFGPPLYCQVRGGLWISKDTVHWTRKATLFTTDWGDPTTFHLWGPTVVFNIAENRWNMFPALTPAGATAAMISRYVSEKPGMQGIAGPYKEDGIVMQSITEAPPWEGLLGIVSFYPYRVGNEWYTFYGSHTNWWQAKPSYPQAGNWMVGLAKAPHLDGPWTRLPEGNPLPIEPVFLENPIVSRIGKWYVAIYDGGQDNGNVIANYQPNGRYCGYSCSVDGIHWIRGGRIMVQPAGDANWADDIRTPLCLIPQGNDLYVMLYTAGRGGYNLGGKSPQTMPSNQYWPVGQVTLRLVDGPPL